MNRQNQFYSVKNLTPDEIREKITELPSLYSDPKSYPEIGGSITNARSALCWIYISLYFQYWETEKLHKSIAQMAYSKNYEGEWANVQFFLEYEGLTAPKFEELYIERYGAHAFYGNFLRETLRNSKSLKVTDRNAVDTRPVKKKQFRRGYNDKGSLRLPHEYHGEKPYSVQRLDRRNKVAHPLLKEKEFSDRESSARPHPAKKGNDLTWIIYS